MWLNRVNAASVSTAVSTSTKTLYLVRHGETEKNVFLRERQAALGRRMTRAEKRASDPGLPDTILTPTGREQAHALRSSLEAERPELDVIYVSPLTRALQTYHLGVSPLYPEIVPILDPRIAERCYSTSDKGKSKTELLQEYGHAFNFDALPEANGEPWWYEDGTSNDAMQPNLTVEDADMFCSRVESFLADFEDSDHTTGMIVCHWGVCLAMTGRTLANCEMLKVDLDHVQVSADTGLREFD